MKYKAYGTLAMEDERETMSEAVHDAIFTSVQLSNNLPACGYIEVATIVRIPNSEISSEMLQHARADVAERSTKVKADLLKWIEGMEMGQ